MTILSTDKNNFKQFLSGNYISNKSLDSCIHAKPSNKYCLIHATQSGGRLIRGGAYSRESANSNKYSNCFRGFLRLGTEFYIVAG